MSPSSSRTNQANQFRLQSALDYADAGLPVFPVYGVVCERCECGREACNAPGKHPLTRRGYIDASTDERRIKRWWTRWPNANIGLVTGERSRLLVVDVDPRNGGDASLRSLIQQNGPFPPTAEQITGGKGRHLFFRYPGGRVPKRLLPGLDVKGDGGYVIVAPSCHISGLSYEWANGRSVLDPQSVHQAPTWLLSLLERKSSSSDRSPLAVNSDCSVSVDSRIAPFLRCAVPVEDVAARLGVRRSGKNYHCWFPGNHANGDCSASVGLRPDTNALQCFVCDGGAKGPVDVVMEVLGLSLPDALRWLQEERGAALATRELALEYLVRSGMFSRLSPAAKEILPVLLAFSKPTADDPLLDSLQISYAAILQFSGLSSANAISRALKELSSIGLVRRVPQTRKNGLQKTGAYELTFFNDRLVEFASDSFRATKAEVGQQRVQARRNREERALVLARARGNSEAR